MTMPVTRRTALKLLGGGTASTLMNRAAAGEASLLQVAGKAVEVVVTHIGEHVVRVSIVPVDSGRLEPIPDDGSLARKDWNEPIARFSAAGSTTHGHTKVTVAIEPVTIRIDTAGDRPVQELKVDSQTGSFTFKLGDGPVLGLGEGGPQFDRRGSAYPPRNGQGGYRLRTHGGRVPIPWLIGTAGWAMLVHHPVGTFDLTGADGRFSPARAGAALPLDVFVVTAPEPAQIMAEYAGLTGLPQMPPIWALGYQQSHRTLASGAEVLSIAQTFREKRLPCDVLIYLGTGFCPSGWNTGHGSFKFNPSVFPDPKAALDQLHALHFHVVPHVVIRSRAVRGTVRDRFDSERRDEENAASYWNAHRQVLSLGVDGWWPDEGDALDASSRLARIRMYYEGSRLDRPDARPYVLHRNGHSGMQRYGAFLWSGDVYSTWETLRTHVPVALNTSLAGIPYWGTDIGGFVPTKELTGELYVRWFQFGAFCPLFRAHGRTWKLRLPWGWNTGELGPNEIRAYGDAANPDASELHNAAVEEICRKYLELRYRLMPYLYSVVREGCRSGLPIMRSLWLHYPEDAGARARGDEYLWGPSILVAPVTEKGATARRVYLPRGLWYEFWTGEAVTGGREISRPVDLATIPLYASAGAIVPMGPLRQYTAQPADGPLTVRLYPGADGRFLLYEDDGLSYAYSQGDWMGIDMRWDDRVRTLSLRLSEGSRMRSPLERRIEIQIPGQHENRSVVFNGKPIAVQL
jgi:alpha-glucosidase/alpha-D-xyloside xylohydrolase